jgi:hypothetical protein
MIKLLIFCAVLLTAGYYIHDYLYPIDKEVKQVEDYNPAIDKINRVNIKNTPVAQTDLAFQIKQIQSRSGINATRYIIDEKIITVNNKKETIIQKRIIK